MKVICIDGKMDPNEFPGPMPTESEIYTVVDSRPGRGSDGLIRACYELAEFPPCEYGNLYRINKFIPLSSIDERELAEQRASTELTITL